LSVKVTTDLDNQRPPLWSGSDENTPQDLETRFNERCEELGRDQVHLSTIGQTRPAAGQIAMADKRAGVGVAFDAMAFHQDYAVPDWFAEVVPGVGGDRHPSLQREFLLLRHQAARASERRLWRR
jgi:hypothetical protein